MAKKKTAAKKEEVKPAQPQLIEIKPMTSLFTLDELQMKDMIWRLKLTVRMVMPKAYHVYTIKMFLNEEPFDNRIKSYRDKIELLKKENRLFAEHKTDEIAELEDDIEGVEKEKMELAKQCPSIDFTCQVEKIEWAAGTKVVLQIPDSIVETLNKQKTLISYYKLELVAVE